MTDEANPVPDSSRPDVPGPGPAGSGQTQSGTGVVAPDGLRVNGRTQPLDLDPARPARLSWIPGSQHARTVVVVSDDDGSPVWSEATDGEPAAELPGGLLAPASRYTWSVQVADAAGTVRTSTDSGFGTMTRWQDSQPVWAPPRPADWRDYDLTVTARRPVARGGTALGTGTVSPGADRLGLVFRAPDYLSGYVWMIDLATGELVPGVRENGTLTPLGTGTPLHTVAPVDAVSTVLDSAATDDVEIRVSLRGDRARTYLDGLLADERTVDLCGHGGVGLTSPANARSVVTQFTVKADDGRTLVAETFQDGRTALACGAVVDRALQVAERSNALIPSGPEWMFLRGGVLVPEGRAMRWATLFVVADAGLAARQFVHRTRVNGTEVAVGPARPVAGEARCSACDVTALLHTGVNTVSALAWATSGQRYQAELVVHLDDGQTLVAGTGEDWQACDGAEAIPASGSIGTGYYAAPREDLQLGSWPAGLDDVQLPDPRWAAPAQRSLFDSIEPAPVDTLRGSVRRPVSVRALGNGATLLDFGRAVIGGVHLTTRRAVPSDLRLRFAELLDDDGTARCPLNTGNCYEDHWRLPAGQAEGSTWGWRVFRYLEIAGLRPEDQVEAIEHVYPLETPGRPTTSDASLDRVLDLCATTIEATNGDLMVDAWSRERAPYEADAYLQARAEAVLSADTALARHTLAVLMRTRTWPTEWPFYLVMLARDIAARTGDRSSVEPYYEQLRAKLPTSWIDPSTGLVRKTTGCDGSGSQMDHDIVDWPASERDGYRFGPVNTVVNATAHGAFEAFADVADLLGRADDAEAARRVAAGIRAGARAHLWDESAGAFLDGLDAGGAPLPHHAAHATAFAVAMGLCAPAQLERAGDFLQCRGMATSVYAAPFLIEALIRCDRVDAAIGLLTSNDDRSWLGMIRRGAGATMEAWNEDLKPNLTCAHPWAASPLFIAAESLAGVAPSAPGYRTFTVSPRLGPLPDLSVRVPTVRGVIGVDARQQADRLTTVVQVPASSTATFTPGARKEELIGVDGVACRQARVELGPGLHTVVTRRGTPD